MIYLWPWMGEEFFPHMNFVLRKLLVLLQCLKGHLVQHNDFWSPNILWIADKQQFIAIDFGLSELMVDEEDIDESYGTALDKSILRGKTTKYNHVNFLHDQEKENKAVMLERAVTFLNNYGIQTQMFPEITSPYILDNELGVYENIEPKSDSYMLSFLLEYLFTDHALKSHFEWVWTLLRVDPFAGVDKVLTILDKNDPSGALNKMLDTSNLSFFRDHLEDE